MLAAVCALTLIVVATSGREHRADHPTTVPAQRAASTTSAPMPAPTPKALARGLRRSYRHASRAQRAATATAYRHQHKAAAVATLKATLPGAMKSSAWVSLTKQPGVKVTRYLTGNRAVVRVNGRKALVSSSLPLQVQPHGVRSAAPQPVSTDLRPAAALPGVVEPKAAISDYQIATAPGARSALADESALRFPRADFGVAPTESARDAAVDLLSDKAVVTNTARDTDLLLSTLPTGVDVQYALRSADSPQDLGLEFTGRVDELRRVRNGGVEYVQIRRGSTIIGTAQAPVAHDADGRNVPLSWSLQGHTMKIHVPHTVGQYAMPILVDPYVVDDQRYWVINGAIDFTGWSFVGSSVLFPHVAGAGVFGNGLNINTTTSTPGYPAGYPSGAFGEWIFTSRPNPLPSPTPAQIAESAHIFKADFGYTANYPTATIGSCMVQGIYDLRGGHYDNAHWRGPNTTDPYSNYTPPYGYINCLAEGTFGQNANFPYRVHCFGTCGIDGGLPTAGAPGNAAIFGMLAGTGHPSANGYAYMGSSLIFQGDQGLPHLTYSGNSPTTWVNSSTISLNAADYGLGIAAGTLTAGTTTLNTPAQPCVDPALHPISGTNPPDGIGSRGDRNHLCSQNLGWSVNTANLPEGSYNAQYAATDIIGNTATPVAIPVKVDRTGPSIVPTGVLYDARGTFVGPNQDLPLTLTATDGTTDTPMNYRSGVASLSVTVDGQPITNGSATQTCTRPESSCPLTVNATMSKADLGHLEPGPHTVQVNATDIAGNATATPPSWTFNYDPNGPTIDTGSSLGSLDGETLTESSYRLTAEALDTDSDLYGSGLKDLVIRFDGNVVATTAVACFNDISCEDARAWDWDTTAAASGTHTITVTATDYAGNSTVDTTTVDLERVPDQSSRTTTSLRRSILGAQLNDHAGTSVAAVGDVNGDGYADYLVGAPNVSDAGKTAAGAAYLILGDASASTVDLATSPSSARRILGSASTDYCGSSVAAAGDINGDGLADMLIGCPGLDPQVGSLLTPTTGKVFVVFGSTTPQSLDLANIATANAGFSITGPSDPAGIGVPLLTSRAAVFGERLQSTSLNQDAITQDVNGDGLGDIVIGDSALQTGAGGAWVIFGKADSTAVATSSLGAGGFAISGDVSRTGGLTGYSASIIGDVDGDNLADILVGSPGSTSSMSGAAYLVSGSDATSTVSLASSGGRAITLTDGNSGTNDRFGVSVAGLGDTNIDGRPDYAIGTRSGAYVVRDTPSSSQAISASNGYAVTGSINDPGLLSTRVPEAPTAASGDIDGDGRADLSISYPDAAGPRGYSIISPEFSRTISTATLPGQRGTALQVGSQGERTGAAISANTAQGTDDETEDAQTVVGSPGSTPDLLRIGAGSAFVLTDINPGLPLAGGGTNGVSLRSTATRAAPRCSYRSTTKPYVFGVGPTYAYGFRAAVLDTSGKADYTGAEAVLPLCRLSRHKIEDTVPQQFQKAVVNYAPYPLTPTPDAQHHVTIGIYDSFGTQIAKLQQTIKGIGSKRAPTTWELQDTSGGTLNTASATKDALNVSVQGYACYVDHGSSPAPRTSKIMIAFKPAAGGSAIRGFANRSAFATAYVSDAKLKRADTTCGSSHGLAQLPRQDLNQSGITASDKYLGKTSAANSCPLVGTKRDYTSPLCGAGYNTYEPSVAGAYVVLALSTTGITGGEKAASAGGGVAMAVVPADGSGKYGRLDTIGYNDPNVPCDVVPPIRWSYINANPATKRPIFGWLPVKTSTTQTARVKGTPLCPEMQP
jgi:hypothetical protein